MKGIDKSLPIPKDCTGIGFSLTEISCLENCGKIVVQVVRQGEILSSVHKCCCKSFGNKILETHKFERKLSMRENRGIIQNE